MDSVEVPAERAVVSVENVGGIAEAEVELRAGVNVLRGRNATNRTSLLQALMAALGSDRASLKADADEGRVGLELGGETYTRTLARDDGTVVTGGSPYLDDAGAADLFAFLLESNEARRAVASGDDLRAVIMRPVDTAAVRAEIETLQSRKRDVEERLAEHADLEAERDRLADERDRLTEAVEATREELAEERAAVEAADADLGESRETKEALDEALSALEERRSELEDVEYRLETERETKAELAEELASVRESLEDAPDAPGDELDELDDRLESLRARKRRLDSAITQLQALVQFNEEVVEGDGGTDLALLAGSLDADGGTDADDSGDESAVTTRLLEESGSLTCWTCGSATSREAVEERLDELRERHRELVAERNDVTDDVDAATDRRSALEAERDRRRELERREEELAADLEEAEAAVEELTERRGTLRTAVEDLEAEVEDLREAEFAELIDRHRAATELAAELEQREAELADVEAALVDVEDRLAAMDDLEAELADVREELAAARGRVRRLETEAVDAFNEHMDEVLSLLDYGNVERIRIERREGDDDRPTTGGEFALHVVRSTDDGAVYEDRVANLSESEREVTGLVFALAGYLVHDVHEQVPFMLLDSLEAIDAERIARLVDYVRGYAGYLVVALLPEDADALADYHGVDEI